MDNEAFGLIQILNYAYKTNFLNVIDEAAVRLWIEKVRRGFSLCAAPTTTYEVCLVFRIRD